MKIKSLVIENYKAIRGRKELTPNGASFFLLGGNGVGKTSVGHALIDMLTKELPSQPITEGENAGYMEFTMDNGAKILGRFVEGKKPVLEFITPEGYNVGSPKELFAKLSGEGMAFDIDDFLKLAPKPLREKLEKVAGLDLSEITQREAQAFEERKLAKAQLADQRGRIQPYDATLVTKQLVSAVEISNQIQALNNQIKDYQAEKTIVDVLTKEYDASKVRVESTEEEGVARVVQLRSDLEEYIKKAEARIAETEAEYEKSATGLKALSIQKVVELTNQEERVNALTVPDEGLITELQSELSKVEQTNTDIMNARRLHDEFMVAQELEVKVANLEARVKAIREEKETKIKASPIPADGVTFSENGDILIDGLPFHENQISASRRAIAGIQIAESMLGDIKYLHFDGAIFDKENADRILEYAESKGLQLCIERPLWEGGELKFEIADHTAQPEMELAHA